MIINGFGQAFSFALWQLFLRRTWPLERPSSLYPFAGYETLGAPLPFPTFGVPSSDECSINLQGTIHTFRLISDSLRSDCKLVNPRVMFIEWRTEWMAQSLRLLRLLFWGSWPRMWQPVCSLHIPVPFNPFMDSMFLGLFVFSTNKWYLLNRDAFSYISTRGSSLGIFFFFLKQFPFASPLCPSPPSFMR